MLLPKIQCPLILSFMKNRLSSAFILEAKVTKFQSTTEKIKRISYTRRYDYPPLSHFIDERFSETSTKALVKPQNSTEKMP